MKKHRLLFINIIVILIIIFNFYLILVNLKLFLPKYILNIDKSSILYEQLELILKNNRSLSNKDITNIKKVIMYEQFPNDQNITIYYINNDNVSKEISLSISSHDDIYSFMINNAEKYKLDDNIIYFILIINIVLIVIIVPFNFIIIINKKRSSK